jgi:autotransporter-associated beta strand protein
MTAGSNVSLTITALTSTGAPYVGLYTNVPLSFYGLSSSPGGTASTVTDTNGTAHSVTASVGTPNTTITFVNGVATAGGTTNGILAAYNGTGAPVTLNCSDGTATSASGTGAAGLSLTVNPAASSQLAFTTSAQSVPANTISGTITVQRQDLYGNPNTTDANLTVNLSSTSGTGVFWNTGHTAELTSVTINTGSSTASFAYEDSATGAPTITAASGTLTSATQVETIAVTLTWSASPATYNWNTSSANWTGASSIYANGDAVMFNDTGSASSPINLVGTLTPVAVEVNTSSKDYTFSTTVSGTISGSAPLLKSGSSTLTISAANSYTGGTTVSGGVVDVQNSTALGDGVATVSSNAVVQVDGSGLSIGESITLNGPGISSGGALRNLANANTWSGAITLATDSRINSDAGSLTLSGGINSTAANLTVGGSGNVTNTGTIATSGMLTKDGSGTLFLVGNNNTYSGGTLISAGVVGISGDGASGGSPGDLGVVPSSATATNIILNGGDLLGSVSNVVLNANRGIGIGLTNGSVGTNALIDAAAGQVFTVSGIIASSGNKGVNNLTINSGAGNTGTVILGGANTFNGTTVISNGFLQVANTLALQDSTVNLNNQGGSLVFDPTVTAATLSALTGDQDLGLTNLNSEPVTLSVGNSSTTTYAGDLVDAGLGGGLTLNGTGTFILTGTNTYTGATTINTGTLELSTGGVLTGGSSLTVATTNGSGTFILNGGAIFSEALDLNTSGNVANPGTVTINSGTANFTNTQIGHDQNGGVITINGGTVSLGAFNDVRDASSSTATLTTGLVIVGGTVTADSVNVSSGNSGGDLTITNGSLTIGNSSTTGGFQVGTGSSTSRGGFLTVSGGTLIYNGTDGLLINNAADTIGTAAFSGGTSTLTGITLNQAGNSGGAANLTISGSAAVYLGTVGLVENSGSATATITLTGGTIGAVASWSSSVPLTLGGAIIFQTADTLGDPFTITLNGALSGNKNLNVTGGGILTLGAANTYTGSTLINGGTLSLASGASITSPLILVGSNTTFDVSQVSSFTLNANQTLSGYGTVNGAVAAASGSTIYPGNNTVTGTLTLSGGLTETGGAVNEFALTSNPLAGNDFLSIPGGLTVSGANTVTIYPLGTITSGAAYPLIYYGTSPGFSGSTNNFTVSGGVISNNTANNTLYFVAASVRAPTNITWLGNALSNNWDTEVTKDWLNTGTGSNDYFVLGDNVLFSGLGAANPLVNIVGTVDPGSITVNTTSTNYTFTGAGSIGGTGGLTITNTGSLTILTTNTYTGPTILAGGTLAVSNIALSGLPSGIGAAPSAPNNLVFSGGTLSYIGPSGASTDYGITLTNSGGVLDISNGSSLTLSGTLTGPAGLTLVDTGTLTLSGTNTYAGATTVSNGLLNLYSAWAASTNTIVMAGGTVGLHVGGQPTFSNALTVTANSTLVSAGSDNNIIEGPWTGSSNVTLNVTIASGTFTVNGSMTNFSGTVELGDSAGTFRFNSGGGNTCFGSPNATMDLGTNTASLQARNAGTMNIGALEGGSGTFVKGQGDDSGLLTWVIGGNTNNPNTTFAGTIENNAANQNAAIIKVGAGTLFLAGQNTYTGSTIISNGILSLTNIGNGDGSISGTTNILLAGGNLDVSGDNSGTLTLGSTQTLAGTGTLTGSLDGTSGVIAPGSPYGNLYVTNSVTLGSIVMNLNRDVAPSNSSISAASINLNSASLTVTNLGGALHVGDTFTLFSGAITGQFNNNPVLPPAYNWQTTVGANSVTIQVISQLRPSFGVGTTTLVGNVLTLNATGGPPNGTWTLLDSTNLATPLTNWTVVATGTLDGSGDLDSYPVTINPSTSPEFYILQLPP